MSVSLLIVIVIGAGVAVLVVAALAATVFAASRRHVVVTVEGTSMAPTFQPGDRLLVRRCGLPEVHRGQAVVVVRPDLQTGWQIAGRSGGMPGDSPWFIKRAAALPGDAMPAHGGQVPPQHLYLLGDNPVSEDSRRWGCCPADRLVGVVMRPLGQ